MVSVHGVDPNLFWGGEIFSLTDEARRAENRGPKGRERGWDSWGGGSPPGDLRSAVSSPSAPGKFEIWCNLIETSIFTTEMPYKAQVATKKAITLRGEKTISPRYF